MSDLVKRLRMDIEPSEGDMESAADLIETQAARIASLEAKLNQLMGPPPDKKKLRQGMMAAGVTEKTANEILKSPAFNR